MATKAKWGEIEVDPAPARRGLEFQVKQRIVILWAQFQRLREIHRAIKDEFGVDLDLRTIQHYDAGNPACRIGKRLKLLYQEARQAYVEETTRIGVAHQAHRLRLIERVIDKAQTAKDFGNALKGLELAAKEMGGVLEGRTTVRHEGSIGHVHMSVEDARAELAMRLGALIDGGLLTAQPTDTPAEGDDGEADTVATEGEGG